MRSRLGFMAVVTTVLASAYSLPCRADVKNLKITRFDINGRPASVVLNTCDKTATLSVRADATVDVTPGQYSYSYEVLKDGVRAGWDPGTFGILQGGSGHELAPFILSVPASSGKYALKVTVGTISVVSPPIDVKVNLGSGPPTAWSRINGVSDYQKPVSVCAYAITLDGTPSNCASGYFVGLELSDPSWNRTGQGYGEWLTGASFQKYGQIGAFNLKAWAEAHYFGFYAGQYYRVKLAVGPVWNEHTKLIYIEPHKSVMKINNQLAGKAVEVRSTEPIILDASASKCPANYYVSIRLSDAAGKSAGSPSWQLIAPTDFPKYGSAKALDVKRFAKAVAKTPNEFPFLPGQFYLLQLRVTSGGASGEPNTSPVHDSETVLRIMDPCWAGPDPKAVSPCRVILN
jgi:hypothetical protein